MDCKSRTKPLAVGVAVRCNPPRDCCATPRLSPAYFRTVCRFSRNRTQTAQRNLNPASLVEEELHVRKRSAHAATGAVFRSCARRSGLYARFRCCRHTGRFFGYCWQRKEQCNIASGSAGAAVFHPSFKDTSAMLQSSFSIDHSHLAPAFRVTMPEIFFFASFTVRREIRLSAAARMISSQ